MQSFVEQIVLTKFMQSFVEQTVLIKFNQIVFSANLRVAGCLEKSAEVMKCMQQLVNVPDVAATMRDMSKEMMKVIWP